MKIKEIIKLVENKEIEELLKTFFNIEYHYNEITKGIEIKLIANYFDIDNWKEFELKTECKFNKYYDYTQKIKNNYLLEITIVKDK